MTKQQLDTAMAMLEAHSEELRRQHSELTQDVNKAITSLKIQLCVWSAIIAVSTFVIVETILSLIK
jgi:Mg2+ and Co2+ transporter CorA